MFSRALTLIVCVLCLLSGKLAFAANEITCDKNPIAPGETVRLRWFFTGDKVVVSGGGFGKGVVVTGKTGIIDKPKTTTRYTFTNNYISERKDGKGGVIRTPIKSSYSIVIEVEPMNAWLTPYSAGRYQVSIRRGWKTDAVKLPGEPSDALVYFQKEDDSVERMSVAVIAANNMTNEELVKKVRASMPSSYNEIINIGEEQTTVQGIPAIKVIFAGKDISHPSTLSHTILVAFVKDNRAYVVSTRTFSAQYEARKRLMEKMLASFVCKG